MPASRNGSLSNGSSSRVNGYHRQTQEYYEELTPLRGGDIPPSKKPRGWSVGSILPIAAGLVAVILGGIILSRVVMGEWTEVKKGRSPGTIDPQSLYDELGRFVMEDYDAQPPFSDFLPGLAGYYGKPLYAFYVNRGQGIASFGFESKEYPIMEFNSANKAYQTTALTGFRTFIQGSRSKRDSFLVEPFSPTSTRFPGMEETTPKRTMFVGANEMQLQERDDRNKIETNVTFIVLPEEDFGAFVKRTTVSNLDKKRPLTISMLDGLAKIEPAGGKLDSLLKHMGRTLEGFMGVYSPYDDTLTMPYFRLSSQPSDTASVVVQEAGHWVLSVLEKDPSDGQLLPIVYDSSKVFAEDTTLVRPAALFDKSIPTIVSEPQYGAAKTSSAFGALESVVIPPGKSVTVSTFFGRSNNILEVPVIARRLIQTGFVSYKVKRTREIITQITAGVETKTSNPLLDGHTQQMFLDNSLRGGIPGILGDVDDDARMRNADEDNRVKVFHLFSRIHGDLERDYNNFMIAPTFFSEASTDDSRAPLLLALTPLYRDLETSAT